MNRPRIVEILETYRPGEGLESDPEVREALELASKDPALAEIRRQGEAFDAAFREVLGSTQVPDSLFEKILQSVQEPSSGSHAPPNQPRKGLLLHWLHPMAFATAAAIILFLALAFTFWNRPQSQTDLPELASGNRLIETADSLYSQLKPTFVSRDGNQIAEYLRTRGGAIPANMPNGFSWDQTFACDVMDVNGARVSVICFKSPDKSNTLHLFTFARDDFPESKVSSSPEVKHTRKGCCATWSSEEWIHVLYSDKGEKKLRQLLDI